MQPLHHSCAALDLFHHLGESNGSGNNICIFQRYPSHVFINDHDLCFSSLLLGWRELTEPCDSHLARFLCLISNLGKRNLVIVIWRKGEVCMVKPVLYSLSGLIAVGPESCFRLLRKEPFGQRSLLCGILRSRAFWSEPRCGIFRTREIEYSFGHLIDWSLSFDFLSCELNMALVIVGNAIFCWDQITVLLLPYYSMRVFSSPNHFHLRWSTVWTHLQTPHHPSCQPPYPSTHLPTYSPSWTIRKLFLAKYLTINPIYKPSRFPLSRQSLRWETKLNFARYE